MRNDFCIFILSHKRPNDVKTLHTLKHCGYSGNWYIILDDEDDTYDQYCKNFGKDKILLFNKKEVVKTFDIMDNFEKWSAAVYARNACFDIARNLGYKYFAEYDDDYYCFTIRTLEGAVAIKNIDILFDAILEFYENTPITTVALCQGGDHVGGYKGLQYKRKAMNSFICSVDRPFKFIGTINEDANAYAYYGMQGYIFLTIMNIQLDQTDTQQNDGGITDTYINLGTYVKSFYTVMVAPSCTSIKQFFTKYMRLHHRINPNTAYPKILREEVKYENKYIEEKSLF